jgi:hypothetical protein
MLPKFVVQGFSRTVDGYSAGQEVVSFYKNQQVRCRVHKNDWALF